ncbi:hypothetical protein C3L33_06560, partial [Rhododendron williamsianum]
IRAPGMDVLKVPLSKPCEIADGVSVWEWSGSAFDEGNERVQMESLNTLNKLLKEPLPVNRFRPNILVDGCEPFSEDLWKEIKINKFTFHGVKLCSPCKVLTINQETAIPSSESEPTVTLPTFRSDKVLRLTRKQHNSYSGTCSSPFCT